MSKYALIFLFALSIVSCKKDSTTNPAPPIVNPAATYTLASTGGNCNSATVQGTYSFGTTLDATNKVSLQVNVTATGTYSISTLNVNNYRFSASGSFTITGTQTVILQGTGTPGNAGINTFPVSAGGSSCSFNVTVQDPSLLDNDNMYFGNPSNAAANTDSANNYLMRKTYYALSYSSDRGTPNWVSWHVFGDDLGTIPRQDDFREDVTLPSGWYQVTNASYNSVGFDRGHNTPSGDRDRTVEANSSTFLMTNMIPQAPQCNQIPWARMEDSLRRLVNMGFEVYTVMGSYGVGGTGSSGFANTIDGGKVTVPARIWKVAVVIPDGNNDMSRVNTDIRVIAVDMPNINTVGSNWKTYRVSVDAIETATGYDILNRIPAAIQTVLEARVDNL